MNTDNKQTWQTPDLEVLDVTRTLSFPRVDNSEASLGSQGPIQGNPPLGDGSLKPGNPSPFS